MTKSKREFASNKQRLRGKEVKLLDHGYLKLINFMGSDEEIVEAARMSTGGKFKGWRKDRSFLEFLWANSHSSPFEMCEVTFEICIPISMAREWMRSRTQSYNEMSGRYTQLPAKLYVPSKSRITKQSKVNKQASAAEGFSDEVTNSIQWSIKDCLEDSYAKYEELLELGVARETARQVLPVAQYTTLRAKANLRNWLHFLDLRMRPNAQEEIRVYAKSVFSILEKLYPVTIAIFKESTLLGAHFSSKEIMAINSIIRKLISEDSADHVDVIEHLEKELVNDTYGHGLSKKLGKALLKKLSGDGKVIL